MECVGMFVYGRCGMFVDGICWHVCWWNVLR